MSSNPTHPIRVVVENLGKGPTPWRVGIWCGQRLAYTHYAKRVDAMAALGSWTISILQADVIHTEIKD